MRIGLLLISALLPAVLWTGCKKEGAPAGGVDGAAARVPAAPGADVSTVEPPVVRPDGGSDAGEPPPATPTDAASGDTPAPSDAEAPADAPAPLPPGAPLGHAAIPERPSDAARRANANGLTAHRAADYEASSGKFAEAVKLASGYDLARYNLACALGRLGRHAEAATELEALLRRDLPSYAPRLAEDPDLETLRAAPEGAKLVELAAALRPAWAAAVRTGIPVVARVSGRWQAGVYVLDERRFLPVAPWSGKTISAGTDPAARHAYLVEGRVDWGDCSEYLEATVRVFSVETFAEVAVVPVPKRAYMLELALDPAGLTLRWGDLVEYRPTGWKRVVFGEEAAPAETEEPAGQVFTVDPRGTMLAAPAPAGLELQGNNVVLPDRAEPLALGRGHAASANHVLLPSSDGRRLLVVSTNSSCEYGIDGGVRHFVDLVDVPQGTYRRLSEGDGAGYGRFDAQGGLLLQTGGALRRWPTPEATEPETLLDGVLLVAPYSGPDCGV